MIAMNPKNLLFLCGGVSAEHEISLRSTRHVLRHVDHQLWTSHVVVIGRDRVWRQLRIVDFLEGKEGGSAVWLFPQEGGAVLGHAHGTHPVDIVFPLLHGPGGEDGSIQGLLEYVNVPYVGSGVGSSAVCLDKIFTKEILKANGLPIVPYRAFSSIQELPPYSDICQALNAHTLVIKPATLGSSVGIAKVSDAQHYQRFASQAFAYSHRIVIEAFVPNAQEVECAVLGTCQPMVSGVGQIILHNDDQMYSYEAKYTDDTQATALVKANIPCEVVQQVQNLSRQAFQTLTASGLARVDFLIADSTIYINEINTMPGFTSISLFPQLWADQGLTMGDLIKHLLNSAIEKYYRQQRLHHLPLP